MLSSSSSYLTTLLLLPWIGLWALGGIWLSRAAFHLRSNEQVVAGIAIGWMVQNWLTNLVAQLVPVPMAFWLSALIVLSAGAAAAASAGWRNLYRIPVQLPPLIAFGVSSAIFLGISRGLAIFDDFAHLPTVSIMATGDIPPHFSLDPSVLYGYHHFLLLFSAQVMRIANLSPWIAIDIGRALAFGLAVTLAGLWAQRLTGSTIAGMLGGMLAAFGSGARWLLLTVPNKALLWLGAGVKLEGSGSASGENLAAAMQNMWAVEGGGPAPFPFAFANGIYPSGVVAGNTANGLATSATLLLLLLTGTRWKQNWLAGSLTTIFIASWGLMGEAELAVFGAGWAIVGLGYLVSHKTWRLPADLLRWLIAAAAGSLIGVLEGGTWTDLLIKTYERLSGGASSASYQTVGFAVVFPPAVVSSHLGVLSLVDPRMLIIALFELGPVLLVFPLLFVWGIKAYRMRRWFEAAAAAAALFSLLMVFVQFTGSTGVRNTSRLYVFMPILAAFAVPLTWMWASRRSQRVKTGVFGMGLAAVAGGVVMFGIELVAIQNPVYSSFITPLDAQMAKKYWNQLETSAMVFDPTPYRAPTVFGRATNSSYTWYEQKQEWKDLRAAPDPVRLHSAGFRYLYIDNRYLDEISKAYRERLKDPCVVVMDEFVDWQENTRELLDLDQCH